MNKINKTQTAAFDVSFFWIKITSIWSPAWANIIGNKIGQRPSKNKTKIMQKPRWIWPDFCKMLDKPKILRYKAK